MTGDQERSYNLPLSTQMEGRSRAEHTFRMLSTMVLEDRYPSVPQMGHGYQSEASHEAWGVAIRIDVVLCHVPPRLEGRSVWK